MSGLKDIESKLHNLQNEFELYEKEVKKIG